MARKPKRTNPPDSGVLTGREAQDLPKSRMRLVSVRMWEEDYKQLQALSQAAGAKSASSFIRSILLSLLAHGYRTMFDLLSIEGPIPQSRPRSEDTTLQSMRERIDELNRELGRIREMIQSAPKVSE